MAETRHAANWRVILTAGLLAGTLDMVFACAWWAARADLPVQRILQSVAAGVLGRNSFEGGWGTALLGLVLHLSIALVMAAVYVLVAGRWSLSTRRPLVCGAVYGLLLYAVMRFVVVPLSAAPGGGGDPAWVTAAIFAHVVLVGMPIAWLSARALNVRTFYR